MRELNTEQKSNVGVYRFRGCENFASERKKLVFNTFIKPVSRF